jgi:hypothetical protein
MDRWNAVSGNMNSTPARRRVLPKIQKNRNKADWKQ